MTFNFQSHLFWGFAAFQLLWGGVAGAQSSTGVETLAASSSTMPVPVSLPGNAGASLETVAPHADRPTVMVVRFESGTVASKVKDKHGFAKIIAAISRDDNRTGDYDPSQLGAGIADMLVEKLLETGQFRVVERKELESLITEQAMATGTSSAPATSVHMTRASYMISGSITKFGFEEHNVGGFAARMATGGLLGFKRHKTEVSVTARVVNTATGEIVASMTGDGESGKGGGLVIGGIFGGGAGGISTSSSNFKESAIGEATERAVQNLTERLVAKKSSF